MKKIWDDDAWEDYLYWQAQDKKTLRRINQLIRDAERDPFHGLGKPEPLKGSLQGWWSRRINETDRLHLPYDPVPLPGQGAQPHLGPGLLPVLDLPRQMGGLELIDDGRQILRALDGADGLGVPDLKPVLVKSFHNFHRACGKRGGNAHQPLHGGAPRTLHLGQHPGPPARLLHRPAGWQAQGLLPQVQPPARRGGGVQLPEGQVPVRPEPVRQQGEHPLEFCILWAVPVVGGKHPDQFCHVTCTSFSLGTLPAGMDTSVVPSLMVRVEKVCTPSMVSSRASTRL